VASHRGPVLDRRPDVPGQRPGAGEPVVRFDRLTKSYRGARGVVDVDLDVRAGEVLGLLGPNGAGKTTLLRTLLDLIRPTAGSVRVLGLDAHHDSVAVRRHLSYLPGELSLPPRLTGRQAIRLYTSSRGPLDIERVERLADRLDLDLDRRVGDLSKGNKQKVGVVVAFAPDVELLVLDEPTSGLDPLLQRTFRDLVRESVAAGRTILLSSHVLEEVEHLADRVALLREGRLVAVDAVTALKARASREVRVRLGVAAELATAAVSLGSVAGVTAVERGHGGLSLRVTGSMDPLVKALAGFEVEAIGAGEPDLEDVFVAYYQRPGPGSGER
jgi:ABC-2 type transport system ATP-binding protein